MQSGKEEIRVPGAPEHAAVSLSPARHLVALPFLEGESWGSQPPPEKREIPPLPRSFSVEATSDGDPPCRPIPPLPLWELEVFVLTPAPQLFLLAL